MALKRLSTENMVTLSADLIRRGSPERAGIEAVPEAAALLPQIEAAHRGLIESQPVVNAEIAKLTSKLNEEDARHDTLVRAIHARLESETLFAETTVDAAKHARARSALFPSGTSIVNRAWSEQAGEAKMRAGRIDDEIERVLGKLKTHDGSTLLERYRALQAVAANIDATEKKRAAMMSDGPSGAETVRARNQWIRVINALAMVLAATGADEAPILGRVRAFEARAEGRGPATPEEPGIEPSEPGPEPSEPTVDPAVPAPIEPLVD